jgi:hypothetical protein
MIWSTIFGIAIAGGIMAPVHPQLGTAPQPAHIQSAAPSTVSMGDQRQLEGIISSIDLSTDTIVLDNGDTLIVPSSLAINRSHLKPDVWVVAQYEERGGRKVATTISIRP